MTEKQEQVLLDLRVRQMAGEHMLCPRCGQDSMNRKIHRNALSRQVGLYVCDDCGTTEAVLEMMQSPMPLEFWACFKAERSKSDFEALPGAVVMEHLQKEQVPRLRRIFEEWQAVRDKVDFNVYRVKAYTECAGLTSLWSHPFQAVYDVADGKVLVRFRATESGTEVALDLIP
mgnify:CR=1 FL=1